jgi:hypothetical protein
MDKRRGYVMKRIFVVIIAAYMSITGSPLTGYCQDESADDRTIEQSESQIGQDIGSEISSDKSQAEAEVSEVETSMNTGQND